MGCGGQCVMTCGAMLMLMLSVSNLDSPGMVSQFECLDQSKLVTRNAFAFYHAGAQGFRFAQFGRGTGSIHLDDVQCTGSEAFLTDCDSDRNTGDCSHFEDASVRCNPGEHMH